MDRNIFISYTIDNESRVALRKESVDRNIGVGTTRDRRGVSLSARRAWIEIQLDSVCYSPGPVALRKESVDRNCP